MFCSCPTLVFYFCTGEATFNLLFENFTFLFNLQSWSEPREDEEVREVIPHTGPLKLFLDFLRDQGRLPFTSSIRVEILGVNIQCWSLSKRKTEISQNGDCSSEIVSSSAQPDENCEESTEARQPQT